MFSNFLCPFQPEPRAQFDLNLQTALNSSPPAPKSCILLTEKNSHPGVAGRVGGKDLSLPQKSLLSGNTRVGGYTREPQGRRGSGEADPTLCTDAGSDTCLATAAGPARTTDGDKRRARCYISVVKRPEERGARGEEPPNAKGRHRSGKPRRERTLWDGGSLGLGRVLTAD